jgi:hypothetical protein
VLIFSIYLSNLIQFTELFNEPIFFNLPNRIL